MFIEQKAVTTPYVQCDNVQSGSVWNTFPVLKRLQVTVCKLFMTRNIVDHCVMYGMQDQDSIKETRRIMIDPFFNNN